MPLAGLAGRGGATRSRGGERRAVRGRGRQDLGALRAAAGDAAVPVLLDVTQAAGWMPLELDWADWVVCAGYKWLLAPRGAAWLAVHPRAVGGPGPSPSWYTGQDRWHSVYGLPLRLADGARRFDIFPAWPSFAGTAPGVVLPRVPSTSTPGASPRGRPRRPTQGRRRTTCPPREAPSWRWTSRTRWNGWPRQRWSPVPGRAALGSASISQDPGGRCRTGGGRPLLTNGYGHDLWLHRSTTRQTRSDPYGAVSRCRQGYQPNTRSPAPRPHRRRHSLKR